MKCKFCETELEEEMKFCPNCGKPQNEAEVPQIADEEPARVHEETEETAVAETVAEQAETVAEESVQMPVKPKVKVWQIVVGAVCSLIVLAALAIVLLTAFGVDLRPRANDIYHKDAYTVSESAAERSSDDVVATLDDVKLDNAMLRMFYRMALVEYLNANTDSLSYLNIDVEKPLSEQKCVEDETLTWEQFFINSAIDTWRNYNTVYKMAMEAGFVPSADLTKSLDELPATMEQMAAEEGFESGDALIERRFGTGCTVADYVEYCKIYYVSAEYINITPTAEQLETYYSANEAMFQQYGIGKDSGAIVNVRHILICPEGGETDAQTGAVTYTQEQWDACYAKTEGIFNDWKAGEATEESFAKLANEKSEDGGSNTNGGLYTGITKDTSFVEPFLNWCMDETRKVGDTGIVKTEYGYHIMYFAYTMPQWEYYANTYFLSEYTSNKIQEGREKWPIEVNYKNIALAALNMD